MEINTDIMRIGSNYYAIQRIEAQEIDINEELKELYEKRHAAHVSQLNDGVVNTAMDEWNTQINHIRSFNSRGSFAINPDKFEKLLMVYRNTLLECRVVMYSPDTLVTNYGYLEARRFEARSIPAIRTLCGVRARTDGSGNSYNNETIEIKFKPHYSIPVIVGYDQKHNALYTPRFRTYHTMGGYNVCTGTHSAQDFWRLGDTELERQMNVVNMFSPATNNANGVRIDDLVTQDTFLSVARRGESTWNV